MDTRTRPVAQWTLVKKLVMWTVIVGSGVGLLAAALVAVDSSEMDLVVWIAVGPTPFLAIAAYLYARRPAEPVAGQLVAVAVASMAIPATIEAFVKANPSAEWIGSALVLHLVLTAVGVAVASIMVGLFPRGIPTERRDSRFRTTVWSLVGLAVLLIPTTPVVPVSEFSFPGLHDVANPLFVPTLEPLAPAASLVNQLVVLVFVAGVVLLVRRYRTTEALRRRQIRWVLYAAAGALLLSAIPWVLGEMGFAPAITHGVIAAIGVIPLLMLPASITIAVLQPNWIDTDAVIRRSAAFAVLSVGVLALYAGITAALGVAAGQRLPVEVAIAVTAVVAAVFHPARVRLQRRIDRWVFGDQPSRFDAVVGLERTIHEASEPGDLAAGLADTVRRALRLTWVEVEIPPGPVHRSGARAGDRSMEVAISHRGERLGTVRCGAPHRTLRADDLELLETLAGQTALAAFNARLAARVVHAQQEERRRIERNLHDGAQQELVALVTKLALARSRVATGTIDEAALLELQEDTKTILRDLRSLAQGIHPSVLSDGGLVEAVRDRASRLPIPVSVEVSPCLEDERFGDDVEGAAYFFVSEALANILKHASAHRATVTLEHTGVHLRVTITDDGVGFDPDRVRRNGLAGLIDRISALSGSVEVKAARGSGAELCAIVPVDREH